MKDQIIDSKRNQINVLIKLSPKR